MSEPRIITEASFIAMHTASVYRTKMGEGESVIMADTHSIAETAMNEFVKRNSVEKGIDKEKLKQESIFVYNEILSLEREVALINLEKLFGTKQQENLKLRMQLNREINENIRLRSFQEKLMKNGSLGDVHHYKDLTLVERKIAERSRDKHENTCSVGNGAGESKIFREVISNYERLLARCRIDLSIANQRLQKQKQLNRKLKK